jgi:hypothetical protein
MVCLAADRHLQLPPHRVLEDGHDLIIDVFVNLAVTIPSRLILPGGQIFPALSVWPYPAQYFLLRNYSEMALLLRGAPIA